MITARPICFVLLRQAVANARSFALLNAGSSMAARMAMIAMTTSNSIRVKPLPNFSFVNLIPALVFIFVFFQNELWRERLRTAPAKSISPQSDSAFPVQGRRSLKNIVGFPGLMVMLVEVTLPLPVTSNHGLLNKLVWLCRIQPEFVGHDR